MMSRQGIAVLGGTFDPVHYGHLRSAAAVRDLPGVALVKLVPCRMPPHRSTPAASALHRVAMLRLATADTANIEVDARELERDGPSHTWDTLNSFRQELGDKPLSFVLGQDAFLTLPEWFRWQELCDLAHLLVLLRPGAGDIEPPTLTSWATPRLQDDPATLNHQPAGAIVKLQLIQVPVSASGVRQACLQGSPLTGLVPDEVQRYIVEQGLYGSGGA